MRHALVTLFLCAIGICTYSVEYKNIYNNKEVTTFKLNTTPSIEMYSTSYYQGNRPRRVKGYDENGDEQNLDPETWNGKDTMYYGWDRNHSNHRYFTYLNGTVYWWSPGSLFYRKGWQTSGYSNLDEFFRNNQDGYDTYYKEPPTPIGAPFILLLMAFVYLLYKRKTNLNKNNL